ncbi:ABC transporter ATP-binding protein [Mycoplasma miroungirhinis]|uniref:ABC transporter ATP-binding protein n=1 Tax=Mycoplasma miroungirhinis TaxID=754516 RepID=A0A6M4JC12_9MOLU|nr:ABC transporter ATP-binding protein [Mycoplasma miroungirhinis]QJR43885.1 ABC transporter ATP-binding protein [Mycoplasma miroungirhinis]
MDKTKKYYTEQTRFGKTIYREIRPGTEEMLNSVDKPTIIEIRNMDVTYGYGSKAFQALKDFNLNIYKGEVLGLVGESGSGKTTAGRAIIGLTPHSFGQIKILDKVVPKNLHKVWKWTKKGKDIVDFMVNKVQMIFQDPTNSLNPFKNVEYIISEGLTNTNNSKAIYLYNFDQQAKKLIYSHLSKDSHPQFFDKFEMDLEKSLTSNDLAFTTFYEDFYNQIISLNNSELTTLFNELKQERENANNITEKEAKKNLVLDILKSVGLDDSVLNRYPLEFSGGQQQRIGICRAIILQPQLLIADEPISALDVSIQAQVINIFKELKQKYNLTILFIAHDLRMVEYISDRIAVMNKGTLLEVGSTKEIIKNPHHPYTQSLLDAVPSIEAQRGSLVGKAYNPLVHDYDEDNQPKWQKISNNHFVLANDEEFPTFKESAKNYKSKIIK